MKNLKWTIAALFFILLSCMTASNIERVGVYNVTNVDVKQESRGYMVRYIINMTPNIERFNTIFYFKENGKWVEAFSGIKGVDRKQAKKAKVSIGVPDYFWVNMLTPVKMKVVVYKPTGKGFYMTQNYEHIFKLNELGRKERAE